MELGNQIRHYRNEQGLSQEALAEKIFVSRQSVSNWENDKTYPDIHTLLLLADAFGVSLDALIKGDVDTMKKEISQQTLNGYRRDGALFSIFLILSVLAVPVISFWYDVIGPGVTLALACVLTALSFYYCGRVELYKKQFDLQTYKEIVAFENGASLEELEALHAARPPKRTWHTVVKILVAALIGAVVSYTLLTLLNALF